MRTGQEPPRRVGIDARHIDREAAAGPAHLRIGGIVSLSITDYPGYLSAVLFCQGCPWRCAYCHNPHLLPRSGDAEVPWNDVVAFLERRGGLLDAVVFSGGEPTLQRALPQAMRTVKAMGFRIGLHTAGIHPQRLALALPHADWVGMDVKAMFDRYSSVTAVPGSAERARLSMELILASGVEHEFRTTVHPALLPAEALQRLAQDLAARGVRRYAVQEFRGTCADPAIGPADSYLTDSFCAGIAPLFEEFCVRRA
jgi:pyruvate formate lyase activating enzyme